MHIKMHCKKKVQDKTVAIRGGVTLSLDCGLELTLALPVFKLRCTTGIKWETPRQSQVDRL